MPQAKPPEALLTLRLTTGSPQETLEVAESLGRRLRASAASGGVTLALEGDLGAGKTLFVRGLARGLGLDPRTAVVSPTFVLAQRFQLPGAITLHHVDAYRLGGESELEAAGLEDICGSGRVTCVEWAGRVAGALPKDRIEVELRPWASTGTSAWPEQGTSPGEGRELTLSALGPASAALLSGWSPPPGPRPA